MRFSENLNGSDRRDPLYSFDICCVLENHGVLSIYNHVGFTIPTCFVCVWLLAPTQRIQSTTGLYFPVGGRRETSVFLYIECFSCIASKTLSSFANIFIIINFYCQFNSIFFEKTWNFYAIYCKNSWRFNFFI